MMVAYRTIEHPDSLEALAEALVRCAEDRGLERVVLPQGTVQGLATLLAQRPPWVWGGAQPHLPPAPCGDRVCAAMREVYEGCTWIEAYAREQGLGSTDASKKLAVVLVESTADLGQLDAMRAILVACATSMHMMLARLHPAEFALEDPETPENVQ